MKFRKLLSFLFTGQLAFMLSVMVFCGLFVSCGADRNWKHGEKYLALGEYYDAANEFRQAYQKTPTKNRTQRGRCAERMGFCYDRSLQSGKAIAAYRNAIRYGVATAETHLALGRLLMKSGNYKGAALEFQSVLDSMPDNSLARTGLEAARKAPEVKELGSRYTVKRMNIFNSRRDDYSPVLFGDEYDQLYFTSTRNDAIGDELSGITGQKPSDIFYSEKDDRGHWSKPEVVSGGVNTAYEEGACCFSVDGREMYLTYCATDPSYPRYAQIVKSNRSDAAWGKTIEVKLTADTLSSMAHPALSPDGLWLYFTSDMPGGKGGLDIWRVRITPAGFGGVENLGSPVNTEGDEEFPTFRPNGDLYFSSNGHPGLGGLDIFIAKVGKDGRYHLSHPGYPLNSQGDDFGMTFEGPHNRGFFSSNRGDARGYDHIYSFDNPEIVQTIKGWVYEMGGYELPAAQVYIVGDDGTNEHLSVRSDGSFTKVGTPGVTYLIMASCRGFLNHQEQVTIPAHPGESAETTLQFALANISAPVLIDNIFYDFDKATLRDTSKVALDKLVTLLKENPNITIELSAHCDYKGSAEYNKRLSQRRAESVVNYLIGHGIAADRLTPVGYGKEQPKKVSKRQSERYKFLAEGTELTPDFIQSLKDKKEQEICNQLNRRTEFRVLRTTYGMFDEKGHLKNPPKPKKETVREEDTIYF
jgi:outer membrane protein OmpA-like peptidoglycan-associated protein/tetratricopeptide (TPR) repeat protein